MKNQEYSDEDQKKENFNTILRMLDESPSAHSGSVRPRSSCRQHSSASCGFDDDNNSFASDSDRSQGTQ